LGGLLSVSTSAAAFHAQAYEQALDLSRKNKQAAALALVQKSYNLNSPELPLQVAQLAATLALNLRDWRQAESIADAALRSHWMVGAWPPADMSAPEVDKNLKAQSKSFLALLSAGAKAKSELFLTAGPDVSEMRRQKLKDETKAYTEALAAAGPEGEKAQTYWTKIQDQEDLAAKEEYNLGLSLNVSYFTWEDRPSFDSRVTARGVFYTPCAGLALNYFNSFYEWTGGGCFGQGTGEVQFDNGTFDTHAQATLVSGYAVALIQVSDHAAFGLEGNFMNLTMTGSSTVGQKTVATASEFAAMAVGRFQISGVEIKFKGGPNFNLPSAVWAVELGVPLYHFF
jgi:hypothetical protein